MTRRRATRSAAVRSRRPYTFTRLSVSQRSKPPTVRQRPHQRRWVRGAGRSPMASRTGTASAGPRAASSRTTRCTAKTVLPAPGAPVTTSRPGAAQYQAATSERRCGPGGSAPPCRGVTSTRRSIRWAPPPSMCARSATSISRTAPARESSAAARASVACWRRSALRLTAAPTRMPRMPTGSPSTPETSWGWSPPRDTDQPAQTHPATRTTTPPPSSRRTPAGPGLPVSMGQHHGKALIAGPPVRRGRAAPVSGL